MQSYEGTVPEYLQKLTPWYIVTQELIPWHIPA